MTQPLTAQQLDDIQARANAATPGPWERYENYGPTFFANIRGSHLLGVGDFNFGVGEQAEADEEFVRHAPEDVRTLLAEVRRLRDRQLTEGEHSAAWHAVEGAAGEEGADPGTILHAVLARLGITWPGTAAPKSEEQLAEACGKCKTPFVPADTRFDGHARYYLTPFCKRCVDACHDNEIADHRCVICA
ncbi:hypothetical protein [Streptomyces sp. ME18-1-4]|uniref:hypothetical protein n=1 Tax=Streptomyces sp. ME18-1-4 TaxID=3028685 RepID=UPI0029B6489F|nr:hypothetical protein [Streptomyces sp. ME18-1-4]MDX3249009.1 hypothetical protein [Streptomyces sp. ME18-1-4]